MDTENVFEPILDGDEKVLKIFKPNKTKMFWSMFLQSFFVYIWIALLLSFSFSANYFSDDYYQTNININVGVFFATLVITAILYLVLLFVVFKVVYSKRFYAYTNKRVVIRKGIIGVDFKSLNKNSIGMVEVNVSLLDKIVQKNTGTIVFGSMSSPIINNHGANFIFAHITNPYELYKEIKANLDEDKNATEKPYSQMKKTQKSVEKLSESELNEETENDGSND